MNLEPNVCCSECSNTPLLKFNEEAENINDYIDLYSFLHCLSKQDY